MTKKELEKRIVELEAQVEILQSTLMLTTPPHYHPFQPIVPEQPVVTPVITCEPRWGTTCEALTGIAALDKELAPTLS